MRKKTNIISLLLAIAMILALSGCGTTKNSVSGESSAESSNTAMESSVAESQQSVEDSSSDEDTEQSTADGNDTKPEYTIVATVGTKYATISLNVRDCPNSEGNKLGTLKQNQEVSIKGQCKETGWYQFEYNEQIGYASDKYLSDEKVEIKQTASNSTGGSGTQYTPSSNGEATLISGSSLLAMVNQDRAENNPGVGDLVWDDALYTLAQQRVYVVYDNYINGRWAHEGINNTYGENAAYVYGRGIGPVSPSYFNSGWINSSGHHSNRLGLNYPYTKYAAVGYYDGEGRTVFIELFR